MPVTSPSPDDPVSPGPLAGGGTGTALLPPAIELDDVTKRYGRLVALANASVTVRAGSVHAFVGANGAGKSTSLGIIAGRTTPSSGTVRVFGEELHTGDARASRAAGIATIYQELTVIPTLSTQANVFIGQELRGGGLTRERAMRKALSELNDRLGVRIPIDVQAGTLSLGQQQMLEIMRALVAPPRVILLDEPTASLAQRERDALFTAVRELNREGVTMIFVSHQLDDVLAVCDTITVFRDGRVIETRPRAQWTKTDLVRGVVGQDLAAVHRGTDSAAAPTAAPRLRVEGVRVGSVRGATFELREGEVLGVAGLVGSGRSSLLRALAGDRRPSAGRIWIDGDERPWPKTIREAQRAGLSLLPEDRGALGLFPGMSAADNILISNIGAGARRGIISRRVAERQAADAAGRVHFDERRLGAPARNLSGGNQQKLLLARWAHNPPRILLADEPTRGVDVGARAEIGRTLRQLAADGMSVLVASSELEELEELCDRAIVLANGVVVGDLAGSGELSAKNILEVVFCAERGE
jgi:ABC-type sugar transport system ATPase subunit